MTPIICLLFTILIRAILEAKILNGFLWEIHYPYMYNVPYKRVYGELNPLINLDRPHLSFDSCLQVLQLCFITLNFSSGIYMISKMRRMILWNS